MFRYTRHRTPRGALADAETDTAIYLLKNVSTLRATYQIRLLAFRAESTGMKLVLKVPKACTFEASLRRLMKTTRVVQREDL